MPLEPFPWILPVAEDLARFLRTSKYVKEVSIREIDDEVFGRFTNVVAETNIVGRPKPIWEGRPGYGSGPIKMEYKVQGESPETPTNIVDFSYAGHIGLMVRAGNSEFPIPLLQLDLDERDRSRILEIYREVDSYLGGKYKRHHSGGKGDSGIFIVEAVKA